MSTTTTPAPSITLASILHAGSPIRLYPEGRTPAELRDFIAAYLRSRGYEQVNRAGDWIHQDNPSDRLSTEQCVGRELALLNPDGDGDDDGSEPTAA